MPRIPGGLADISVDRPIIEDGEYPATITGFEYKTAGTGAKMFAVETTIREGAHKDHKHFENIVIENKDGQRNEVGLRRLKKIITQLKGEETANDPEFDTDELVGLDCIASFGIRQGRDPDDPEKKVPENNIKRYIPA